MFKVGDKVQHINFGKDIWTVVRVGDYDGEDTSCTIVSPKSVHGWDITSEAYIPINYRKDKGWNTSFCMLSAVNPIWLPNK